MEELHIPPKYPVSMHLVLTYNTMFASIFLVYIEYLRQDVPFHIVLDLHTQVELVHCKPI